MMDEQTARRMVHHLVDAGGTDVLMIDGDVYEVSCKKLDGGNIQEAIEKLAEGMSHERRN